MSELPPPEPDEGSEDPDAVLPVLLDWLPGQMTTSNVARYGFRLERRSGVVVWSAGKDSSRRMAAPGTGAATALPVLSTVAVVQTNVPGGEGREQVKLLILAGEDNGCLGRFPASRTEFFDQTWPPEVLQRLQEWGVQYEEHGFEDMRAVNEAFPGAVKHWRWFVRPYNRVLPAAVGLGLIVAVLLLLFLLSHL